MSRTSRDGRRVHADARDDVRFVRASGQAQAVTTFLQEQDVRPAPRGADIEAFLGRSDTALFFAQRGGRIIGTLGCVLEGAVLRLVHFTLAQAGSEQIAGSLVSLAEAHARSQGAAVLAAQAVAGSAAEQRLRLCGFAVDWEEGDARDGRVVTIVDLTRPL
jgi:hypothetical protein